MYRPDPLLTPVSLSSMFFGLLLQNDAHLLNFLGVSDIGARFGWPAFSQIPFSLLLPYTHDDEGGKVSTGTYT